MRINGQDFKFLYIASLPLNDFDVILDLPEKKKSRP